MYMEHLILRSLEGLPVIKKPSEMFHLDSTCKRLVIYKRILEGLLFIEDIIWSVFCLKKACISSFNG